MEIRLFSNSIKVISALIFALFLGFSTVKASESPVSEEAESSFDITEFIFHHIADAHEFAIFGKGESWVGLHLPVILWTDNGLVTFSSKAFQLDDSGQVVVEKGGAAFHTLPRKDLLCKCTGKRRQIR